MASRTWSTRVDPVSEAIDFAAASLCSAERSVPTVRGILLFGRERLARFPDAHIQAGRFPGTGRVRRSDLPLVPPAALREALVTAVVHADYPQRGGPIRIAIFDDRIEIENPGTLLPGLTLDDLRDGVSRVRNRAIARVLKELRHAEQ
jgi:ATP-dependent DNA helicase RecG